MRTVGGIAWSLTLPSLTVLEAERFAPKAPAAAAAFREYPLRRLSRCDWACWSGFTNRAREIVQAVGWYRYATDKEDQRAESALRWLASSEELRGRHPDPVARQLSAILYLRGLGSTHSFKRNFGLLKRRAS